MKKRTFKNHMAMWGQIIFGLLLYSAGYGMFLIPSGIAAGGFTGIGQIVNHLTGFPVGTFTLILNVPLFLMGIRSMGWSFGIRSAISTAALLLALDWIPYPAVIPPGSNEGMMLATIFGGVLAGAGMGLIVRGQASTGGTELLARLVNSRFPVVTLGTVMFVTDGMVILASGFAFDILSAMFALITAFLMSWVTDFAVNGLNSAHAYMIISSKSKEISAYVLGEMRRGATTLYGRGTYSEKPQEVLLCVISRMETVPLRSFIASIDPDAFVIGISAQEVLGNGFAAHALPQKKKIRKP